MSAEFPASVSRRTKIAVGVLLVVTLAYSFVIAGQILVWFLFAGIVAGTYIAWLFVLAVFRLVEAVERLAAAKEAEIYGTNDDHPRETGRTDVDSVAADTDSAAVDTDSVATDTGANRSTDDN